MAPAVHEELENSDPKVLSRVAESFYIRFMSQTLPLANLRYKLSNSETLTCLYRGKKIARSFKRKKLLEKKSQRNNDDSKYISLFFLQKIRLHDLGFDSVVTIIS